MSCCHHPDREAVAQCSQCGKPLCETCANLYSPPFCADCVKQGTDELQQELWKLGSTGIIMAISYIACIFFTANGYVYRPVYQIVCGLVFGCVPFGWKTLTSITPRMFLYLPIIGWLIYFVLKFIISLFIGWIAAPIKIYTTIQTINKIACLESQRQVFCENQPGHSEYTGTASFSPFAQFHDKKVLSNTNWFYTSNPAPDSDDKATGFEKIKYTPVEPAIFKTRTKEKIVCPKCGQMQPGNRSHCSLCQTSFKYEDE